MCSAVKVVGLRQTNGAVTGARLHDLEADRTFEVVARQVINATGVWSDKIQAMAGGRPMFSVQASKGVHILVPRTKIDSAVSMFVRAEDSVLIVRTWGRHWLIGTTDTAWDQGLDHPAATSADVDYLLRNLNRVLEVKLTRTDIEGVFAGLRPLLKGSTDATSKLSREHAVESPVPGFTSIVGGKYTTYRVMARDVVDHAVKALGRPVAPCNTENIPLLGAVGLEQARQSFSRSGAARGLTQAQIERLLGRYGSLVGDLDELMARRPDLAKPIGGAGDYLRVEPVYSATHEGALHLDDVLTRRTHIAIEAEDHGLTAAAEVASLMGPELGWDEPRVAEEISHYRARVDAEIAAQLRPDDESAMKVRNEVRDLRLMVADLERS